MIFAIIIKASELLSYIMVGLICLHVAGSFIWRFVCLFRKKGSCKFRHCPFRQESTNFVYPSLIPCTKCPLTKEEIENYKNALKKLI
ncbi:hypothetical protein D7X25_05760 [bacterium 1XD42-8]|nr:hypothetical protein D7X25_05760 [bacterium 1XD42-8]